jgi:DNA-binding CsgD family transcriptional regulator
MRKYAHRFGMYDAIWITAAEPSGWGCGLHAGRPRIAPVSRQSAARWARVGAHLSAAVRLRRKLAAARAGSAPSEARAEAVFLPDGRACHVEGRATDPVVLDRLRESVLRLEQLRARAFEGDEAAAIRAWQVLIDGRWSLVDGFQREGRRYILARENEPTPPGVPALTLRERQVVGCASLGHDNQVIAYELGISHSSVRALLTRAATKLGAANRDEVLTAYRAACEPPCAPNRKVLQPA